LRAELAADMTVAHMTNNMPRHNVDNGINARWRLHGGRPINLDRQ
jgi:hypothetical protein